MRPKKRSDELKVSILISIDQATNNIAYDFIQRTNTNMSELVGVALRDYIFRKIKESEE